jgi:hypothetical protein
MSKAPAVPFSRYQKIVVAMLAFLQFAVILDFMLMSPLGAVIMPALNIGPASSAWWSRPTPSAPARPAC